METIEERAMEKYWPDDFKQKTVEKISTEVVSYITEQIESAINEEKQRSVGTIEERAKEYAPDSLDPDYILPAREEYIVKQQQQAYKAYIAGAKDQQYINKLFIEQLIEKAWSLANSMYQAGKDNLVPLTKDEFVKLLKESL